MTSNLRIYNKTINKLYKMKKTLAPFVKIEESFQFYLNNRSYEINENTISIVENPNNTNLLNAIYVLENFNILENTINWYSKGSKFIYNIEEGKFYNGTSMIAESFSTFALASGLVRYHDKAKAEMFENLPNIIENFMFLDFATTFKKEGITVDLFKLDENIFISRFNKDTSLSKFFAPSANEAVEYIKEQTSIDASEILIELLEGDLKEIAKRNDEISKYNDMIDFLKDQRGLLAEADKTVSEIAAADSLINSEIAIWQQKIEEC